MFRKLFLCTAIAALMLAMLTPVVAAQCGGGSCGSGGRTIVQTGGGCGGGSCGSSSPSMRSPISPAPVPEFAQATWNGNGTGTMTSPMRVAKPTAPRVAMQLPVASPVKTAMLTSSNGRDTLQMQSDVRPLEVPYTTNDLALTTSTDGANTLQMKSDLAAGKVPAQAADLSPAAVPLVKPISLRLTLRK